MCILTVFSILTPTLNETPKSLTLTSFSSAEMTVADAYRPIRKHVPSDTDARTVRCGCAYRPIRTNNDGPGVASDVWRSTNGISDDIGAGKRHCRGWHLYYRVSPYHPQGKSDIARQPMLVPSVYQKPPDGLGGQYILQLQAALFKDAVRRYAKFLANTNNPFSETRLRLFFCYV